MFAIKGKVFSVKCVYSKPVHLLTSCFSPKNTTYIYRTNKDASKINTPSPKVVAKYHRIMKRVDKFDQFYKRYAIRQRSIKLWYQIL